MLKYRHRPSLTNPNKTSSTWDTHLRIRELAPNHSKESFRFRPFRKIPLSHPSSSTREYQDLMVVLHQPSCVVHRENWRIRICRIGRCLLAFQTGKMPKVSLFHYTWDFKPTAEVCKILLWMRDSHLSLIHSIWLKSKPERKLRNVARSRKQSKWL